jgi:uncharacterized protein (DUF1778 family)
MKIEIKEDSKEKELIERAVSLFGYKTPTQFILAAISSQYRLEVNKQLEIAAEAKNQELATDPDYMPEVHRLQGIANG